MSTPTLHECRAASIPPQSLAALAPLRLQTDLWIREDADRTWVYWNGALPAVVSALLPVHGVVFYTRHGPNWRPVHAALPDLDVPKLRAAEMIPMDRAIVPAPIMPVPPDGMSERVPLGLVPCPLPRPATALRCHVQALRHWGEQATNWEIEHLRGAVCGHRAWVRGERLPAFVGAERFWGDQVLVPLGWRPDPDWPERLLREAGGVVAADILVLTTAGAEAIPAAVFQPLSRSGIRQLVPA